MRSASLRLCEPRPSQPSGGRRRSGSQNALHAEPLCAGERGRNGTQGRVLGDRGRAGRPRAAGGVRPKGARSLKPPCAGHQRALSPGPTSLRDGAGSRWA